MNYSRLARNSKLGSLLRACDERFIWPVYSYDRVLTRTHSYCYGCCCRRCRLLLKLLRLRLLYCGLLLCCGCCSLLRLRLRRRLLCCCGGGGGGFALCIRCAHTTSVETATLGLGLVANVRVLADADKCVDQHSVARG